MLRVKLLRGYIGCTSKQRDILRALGLRKISSVRLYEDTPSVRGMLEIVKHLVEVKNNEIA